MIRDEIADQLVYSTVRIVCKNETSSSCGTGFFMVQNLSNEKNICAIVTNNHVVDGYDVAEITLVGQKNDGTPDNNNHITVTISNLQANKVAHPNSAIDICLLFINKEIADLDRNGTPAYFRAIDIRMSLFSGSYDTLTSIEDVIMIGYPNGIIDRYNNKPVVRKGITATNIKLDYNGNPDFMVDISCFYGSSGSPVFLRKEGLAKEPGETGITIGLSPTYYFLGIIHSMSIATASGEIVIKEIPTAKRTVVETTIPLNLGQVTKASKILEIFDIVQSQINKE